MASKKIFPIIGMILESDSARDAIRDIADALLDEPMTDGERTSRMADVCAEIAERAAGRLERIGYGDDALCIAARSATRADYACIAGVLLTTHNFTRSRVLKSYRVS